MSADEIARILDVLGERLGPAGERAFALAVQYHVTSALVWFLGSLAVLVVGAVVAGALLRLTVHRYQAQAALYAEGKGRYSPIGQRGPDLDDYVMPWLLGGGVAVLVALPVGALMVGNLITLLNPEYAAIRDLLGRVKP